MGRNDVPERENKRKHTGCSFAMLNDLHDSMNFLELMIRTSSLSWNECSDQRSEQDRQQEEGVCYVASSGHQVHPCLSRLSRRHQFDGDAFLIKSWPIAPDCVLTFAGHRRRSVRPDPSYRPSSRCDQGSSLSIASRCGPGCWPSLYCRPHAVWLCWA